MAESSPHDPGRITKLCDAWAEAVRQPGGGFAIGASTERFRLLQNGLAFHALTYDELRAACLGLGRNLLLPGMNTVIDFDHTFFWAWCAEVIQYNRPPVFSDEQRALSELFGACVRAALANARKPASSKEEWEQQRAHDGYVPFQLREFGHNAHLALAYLSFPLLERVAKLQCSDYVDLSGKVLKPFSIQRPGKSARRYVVGQSCSSLRDLLTLLHLTVARPSLAADLRSYESHLKTFGNTQAPFDVLYGWRNTLLHGGANYPTIGGTVFNLAVLLLLDRRSADFEVLRDDAWKKVQWELQTSGIANHRPGWSYYPPF